MCGNSYYPNQIPDRNHVASKKTTPSVKKSTTSKNDATRNSKATPNKTTAKKINKTIVKKAAAKKAAPKKAAPKKNPSVNSKEQSSSGLANGTKKVTPFQMASTKTTTTPVMQLIANVTKTATSISVHRDIRSDKR